MPPIPGSPGDPGVHVLLAEDPQLHALTKGSRVNVAIALGCVLVLVFVWTLTLTEIQRERRQDVTDAMRQNANLAIAFEEHTVSTLKSVDQILLFVKYQHEHDPGAKVNLRALLPSNVMQDSPLLYIGQVDLHGDMVAGSESYKPTNVSDLDWFAIHQHQPTMQVFLSRPRVGRVLGVWVFHMSRRLNKADGTFDGVVYASVDPAHFLNFYRKEHLGEHGLITLVGLDNITRARRAGTQETFGDDMSASTLIAQHAEREAGSFVSTGRLEGVARIVSYRGVRQFPLIVAVGTSQTEVLVGAHERGQSAYAAAALFSLFVVASAVALAVALARQRRASAAVACSEMRFRAMFDQAAVGIARSTPELRILEPNPKLCEMLGYSKQELLGRNLLDLSEREDTAVNRESKSLAPDHPFPHEVENRYLRKDASPMCATVASALVRCDNGEPNYVMTVIQDITPRKRAEDRLAHLVSYDALTGMPNRFWFSQHLGAMIAGAERTGGAIVCMIVKLDHFRDVNSVYGRAAADNLLRQVAARLRRAASDSMTVARLGDDEFAVVLSDGPNDDDIGLLAQKFVDALSTRFILGGPEIFISANVGAATYPDHAHSAADLLRHSEQAMYDAIEQGRNTFRLYLPRMNERVARRFQLDADLHKALERREFLLHYQPKVDLATGAICGLEALLRWQHPKLGLMAPADFVPTLETTGLIGPVGEWVLQTVCEQINTWKARGITIHPIGLNLSAQQFDQVGFDERVRAIIAKCNVDARLIELEITESMLMHDPAEVANALMRLKRIGVKLSIDDFGTGYSSLAYLKRFPLDSLKIDRVFVRDVVVDSHDAALVLAIINLAHDFKLKVIAEGVETEAQMNFLRSNGCDQMQGYFFARPLSVEDCTQMLIDRRSLQFPTPASAVRSLARASRRSEVDASAAPGKEIELATVELEWLRRCGVHACGAPFAVTAALGRAGVARVDDAGRLHITDAGKQYVKRHDFRIKERRRKASVAPQ